jgi:hypothetical protein
VVTVPAISAAAAASDPAPARILLTLLIPCLHQDACPRSRAVPVRGVGGMPNKTLPGKKLRDKGTHNVGKVISRQLNGNQQKNIID